MTQISKRVLIPLIMNVSHVVMNTHCHRVRDILVINVCGESKMCKTQTLLIINNDQSA